MPLTPGTTLGPYSVTAKIGEGGMGEVYRARDTKLDRDVALKVLPEAFTQDPDRLARFEREAKVLASLNHPNIAAIYGLEEADDTRALVLELVEGPTLADRIKQGPIPLDEALPIAKQIAEALEAAHEAGVIHRDLKPANIKVRDDGTVKVLDFGLAKALDPNPEGDPSQSPTLTAAATQMGMIMGTAAYMSPEQARGKTTDRRSDIWAFGVVLFEMLTGERAFVGDDVSLTLAKVLEREPSLESLPDTTPPKLRNVLQRCLEKEPRQRVQAIGDVRLAMEGAFETVGDSAAEDDRPRWRLVAAWATVAFLVGGIGGTLIVRPSGDIEESPRVTRRFSISRPEGTVWLSNFPHFAAVSPDGADIVYTAAGQLYHHSLIDGRKATRIHDAGVGIRSPFFSPDGEWIAYWAGGTGTLLKKRLAGGSAQTICSCESSSIASGTWGPNDTIIFSLGPSGLFTVPASGGEPEPLTTLQEGELAHMAPHVLPEGRGVMFTVMFDDTARPSRIAVELSDGGGRDWVVEGSKAVLTATGHLVYGASEGDSLWAAPLDLDRLEIRGDAALLVEDLRTFASQGFFALGADGTLVYLNRELTEASQLVWVDRQGVEELLPLQPGPYFLPKISPDGQRIAVEVREPSDTDIWVYDLEAETFTQLAAEPQQEVYPLWTPDSQHVIFSSLLAEGEWSILQKSAYGTGEPELLNQSDTHRHPLGWSGTTLILGQVGGTVGLLALESGQGQAEPLFDEFGFRAAVSAAGQWIAYNAAPSGTVETWVRPLSDQDGRRLQVSQGGGISPAWSPTGTELFYRTFDDEMMSVKLNPDTFALMDRQVLFVGSYLTANGRMYDVAPDGGRFLMVKPTGTAEVLESGDNVQVVTDWFEELTRLVPSP